MKDKFYHNDGTTSQERDWSKPLHRIDGPAAEYADGEKQWFQNGERHRADGPAIECANGDKIWYQNGERHRNDGPAVEYANGYVEWYVRGKEIKYRPMTTDRLQKILVLL